MPTVTRTPARSKPDCDLIPLREARKALGCSNAFLTTWMAAGRLRWGRRGLQVLVSREDVEALKGKR